MKQNRDMSMFYPGMNPMMPGMPGSMGMPGMGGMPGSMGMPGMGGMPGSMGMPGMGGMSNSMGTPNTGMAQNGGMPNNQFIQGYAVATAGDLDRRVETLERQMRRIETRVARLESPYVSTQPYSTSIPNQEPGATPNYSTNTMHMM